MTLLPGTNYLSNSARTEAEMKVALDQVNEVIAEIGSQDVTTLTITAADAITTPLSSMVSVMPEGAGIADTLSSIGVSNIDKGRMVILQHAESPLLAANGITLTHGTSAAAIEMLDGVDFVLCANRMICLIYTGATGHWKEVWRGYGRETESERLAERTDMGLGTASVEHIAGSAAASKDRVLKVKTDTNLVTGDVLAVNTSGQIVAATITTNADTLDLHDSTEFVRKTGEAAQSIDDDLTVATTNASLIADGTSTAALRLKGTVDGTTAERAFIEMTASDGEMVIGTIAAGGGATESIRLNPGDSKFEFNTSPGTDPWEEIAHAGNIGDVATAASLGTTQYYSSTDFSTSKTSQSYSDAPLNGSSTSISYTIESTGVSIDLIYHCSGFHNYVGHGDISTSAGWQYQVEDSTGSVLTAWRYQIGDNLTTENFLSEFWHRHQTFNSTSGTSHNHHIGTQMMQQLPPLVLAIDGTGNLVAGNVLKFRMRMRSGENSTFNYNFWTQVNWSTSTLRVVPGVGV